MAWRYSVLVVANVTAASDELVQALAARAARDSCDFTLLVPATGGGSAGRQAARKRMEAATEKMRAGGLEVKGRIGDPDPVAAVHDVWDPTSWDEVIVSTLPTDASRWLQVDLPHRIEKLTGVPVTHVVAQPPRQLKTEPPPARPDYGVLAPLAPIMRRSGD